MSILEGFKASVDAVKGFSAVLDASRASLAISGQLTLGEGVTTNCLQLVISWHGSNVLCLRLEAKEHDFPFTFQEAISMARPNPLYQAAGGVAIVLLGQGHDLRGDAKAAIVAEVTTRSLPQ